MLLTFTVLSTEENQVVVVDQNGSGDYTSISQAINYATSGSTIIIKAGEYSEIIDIRKPINLVGEDKTYTIINPISEKNKYAICLGAPESSLSGLTIINGAPGLYSTGVKITVSNTEIDDCNFFNTPIGIAVWSSENNIKNCVFKGCEDEGIALLGSKYTECHNNEILNCTFYDNCDGVELQYSSGNTISNCEFYENTHTGIDAIAKSNNNNVISDCKIYNNRVHGIYLSGSSDNKIINCEITENQDGNIIMNEYSQDNQIINKKVEFEDQIKTIREKFMNFFENIIQRLVDFRNNRFGSIISDNNF